MVPWPKDAYKETIEALEVRERRYYKDDDGRINEVEGTPDYLAHHERVNMTHVLWKENDPHPGQPEWRTHYDRMREAAALLKEKASWDKTKNSPAPKST